MDEIEEGQLSDNEDCATDAIDAPYKPLARPSFGMPKQQANSNDFEELKETGLSHVGSSLDESDDETPASRILLGYKDTSSGSGSDSDDSANQPSRKMKRVKHTSNVVSSVSNGGEAFQRMATEYQRSRVVEPNSLTNSNFPLKKKANNIWGNLLNEEILTADMSDIAVGRSAKKFRGDRGAESYNYPQAQRDSMTSKNKASNAFRQELDKELNAYWSKRSFPKDVPDKNPMQEVRRDHAIMAGKKRSIKERLGRVKRSHSREAEHNNLDDLSIPPPGVPRTISDVPTDILNHFNGIDNKGEGTAENIEADTINSSDECYALGEELAAKLSEPKIELIVGVVELVGAKIALNLFTKTQGIERDGGMMIKNGQRRRTPGGVFLQLLRELATSNTEPTIDPKKVKKFFAASVASCQKPQRQSRPKMPPRDQNVKGPYNPKVLNPKITIVLLPFWLLETSSYLVQILHKITNSKMKLFKKTSQTMVETKHGGSFQSELAAFQRLSKKQNLPKNSKPGTSKRSSSNPLPDLIASHDDRTHKSEFYNGPPEAPPNSVEPVERPLSTYDDDFLSLEVDDIIEFDQSA